MLLKTVETIQDRNIRVALAKLASEKIELVLSLISHYHLDLKNTILIDDRFTGDDSTLTDEMFELVSRGLTIKSLSDYTHNNTMDYRNTIVLYINRIPEYILNNILNAHVSAYCNILVGDNEVLSPEYNNYQFKYYNMKSVIVSDNSFSPFYSKDVVSLLNKSKKRKYKLINTEELIVNYKTVDFHLVDLFNVHEFRSDTVVTSVDNVANFNAIHRLELLTVDNIVPHINDTYFTESPIIVGGRYIPIGSKITITATPLSEMWAFESVGPTMVHECMVEVFGEGYYKDLVIPNVNMKLDIVNLSRYYSMSHFSNINGFPISDDSSIYNNDGVKIMPSFCIPCYFSKYTYLKSSDIVYSEEIFINPFFTASSYYELLQGARGPLNVYYKNFNYHMTM
ncbi:MAG: hypothetical protein ACRCX2_34255 [Paraclostridium sp.]